MATILGTEGSDTLWGSSGSDSLDARGGNDSLIGGAGNDTLLGGYGNDSLDGGQGADTLTGGVGYDQFLFRSPQSAVDRVTDFRSAVDALVFDNNYFVEVGAAGAFVAGDPRFTAGAGFTSGRDAGDRVIYDTATGNLYYDADGSGAGASQLIATLQGAPSLGATDIRIVGLSGVEVIGSPSADRLHGTRFDDTIDGGLGVDTMEGGLGNDIYIVTSGDVIYDSGGIDTVFSGISWSLGAYTNVENLTLTGTAALTANGNNLNNVIRGNDASNPSINGKAGNDTMFGGGGNDTFDMSTGGTASYGNDVIDGGAGVDTVDFGINARSGVSVNLAAGTMSGGGDAGAGGARLTSVENVIGGGYADRLTGNGAANRISGQGGNDTLAGGTGIDTLIGGAGADSFVFAQSAGSYNADRILDFASGTDQLLFENSVLTALGAAGDWMASDGRFHAASGAVSGHDWNDRLIYNTSTGNLYYDADGSGAGTAQIIATLSGAPALAASDITVI